MPNYLKRIPRDKARHKALLQGAVKRGEKKRAGILRAAMIKDTQECIDEGLFDGIEEEEADERADERADDRADERADERVSCREVGEASPAASPAASCQVLGEASPAPRRPLQDLWYDCSNQLSWFGDMAFQADTPCSSKASGEEEEAHAAADSDASGRWAAESATVGAPTAPTVGAPTAPTADPPLDVLAAAILAVEAAHPPARQRTQYAKLRYAPPSAGGRCGVWEGMTVHGEVHEVRRNGFQSWCHAACKEAPNGWIKLKPGRARGPTEADAAHGSPPTIAYRQGPRHSCVFSSAASALVHAGEGAAAAVVAARIAKSLEHGNPMAFLHDIIKSKKVPTMEVMAIYKRGQLNVLSDRSHHLTTVQLLGEDGGVGHAITIVDEWIFDATLPFALPLTRASLDACCSSQQGLVAYRCVERAVRYRRTVAAGGRLS